MSINVKILFVFACAFVLFSFTSSAQAAESRKVSEIITPKVQSVELYPSGARFIFAVKAPAGNVQLELPGAFNESSVRVLSPEGLEGLQAIRRSRPDWVPPSLAQLKEGYDAQKKKVAQLTARELSLSQTIKLLESLKPGKEQATNAGELITYIKEAQALKLNTENKLAELQPELEREEEKLDLLENELERRAPRNANSWLDVTGRMTAGGATKEVLFEARTDCASWRPHYRMNLDSATGAIHAQLYASVEQSTGLDYTGDILFHTRVPDDNVRSPRLEPLRVSLAPKVEARSTGASSKFMNRMSVGAMAPMMADMVAEEAEDDYAPASKPAARVVNEAITLTDRAVSGAGALPGDRSKVQFELGEIKWNCVPEFMLIPEQQKDAWILASMDQDPDNNANVRDLIPGMAELFVDGAPAGQTNIPEYGLEQMKLPFGRVALLTAKKEPLVSMTGSSWFNGDSVARGYKLKITNGTDTDKTVTVRDRLPISTVEKVKLEVRKIDPEPFERDKENRLTWKLDIKAGETVEILVDYTLNYPSGETLQYR